MRTDDHSIVRVIKQALDSGASIDLDGIGTLKLTRGGSIDFVPARRPRVFLAYVAEDHAPADRLYRDLRDFGFDPWLDRRKLLPGQNWPRAIQEAIFTADYFVACFSTNSVLKRGAFQAEIRYALDCARRVPLDEPYLIPVRLDPCPVPRRIHEETQYIDLFPDWGKGLARLRQALARRPPISTSPVSS